MSPTDFEFSFEELVRVAACDQDWVMRLIEESVIEIHGDVRTARFSGYELARVRQASRIHRDFEASAPAAALILQLLDELRDLRRQVRIKA